MGKNRLRKYIFPVLLLLITSALGCSSSQSELEDLREKVEVLENENTKLREDLDETKEAEEKPLPITVYSIKETETDFWLVPEIKEIPGGDNVHKTALEELIKVNHFIPDETQVIDVGIENFIAQANFSKELSSLAVGSSGESLVISAIANTLIKFPDVEKVQILIEGEKVESLAGHIIITEPVGRNDAMLLLNSQE